MRVKFTCRAAGRWGAGISGTFCRTQKTKKCGCLSPIGSGLGLRVPGAFRGTLSAPTGTVGTEGMQVGHKWHQL